MDIQAKFKFFIAYNLQGESDEVKNAFTLNESNHLDIRKPLELGMSKDYLLKLKQAWKEVVARKSNEDAELNAIADSRKDQKRISVNIEDL